MSDERTSVGTVAQFEAWLAASEEELPFDPASGARHLADLFASAERGGADLHDPTGELILWLSRDLARDDGPPSEEYTERLAVLPWYLLFLRSHELWRRSERAVQECWEAIDIAAQRPLGLTTLGSVVDGVLADRRSRLPASADVLATGIDRAYVAPLRATLDALAERGALDRSAVAALAGVAEDTVALELWLRSLGEAGLARVDDGGLLRPLQVVTDAGGCPPPSTDLVNALVRGITRAGLWQIVDADAADGLDNLPRATALLMAVIGATDETLFLPDPDDSDDPEEGSAELVEHLVERLLPGPEDERLAPFTAEVITVLQAMIRFGVLDEVTLPQGSIAYLAPEPFRHATAQAVSDVTGAVGAPEDLVPWEPVELPFTMREDAGLDLVASFEHDPGVWRRFRILGSGSLASLHAVLQEGFGWRDTRSVLFCTGDGTPRATVRSLLRTFRDPEHAAVVDADALQIGSLLKVAGDELGYRYGEMSNPWRIRVRLERLMTGIKDPLTWLDRAGDAPAEPTRIGESLQARLPEGMTIPAELEAAWAFMESKRWAMATDDGTRLVAPGPPQARPAIVFSDGLTLLDRYEESSPVLARTHPIAGTSLDTRFALWLDDDGLTKVVAFMPDGGASLIGSPLDLLRLAAIGYQQIAPDELGQPPQHPEAVAGMAEFRGWLRSQVGADVPELWGRLGNDEVTAWVAAQGGDRSRSG